MTTTSHNPADKAATSTPDSAPSRRALLRGAAITGLATLGTGLLSHKALAGGTDIDLEILNFALNLEYLEAEYYTYATSGMSIRAFGIGTDGSGDDADLVVIKPDPMVPFKTPEIQQFAEEIANDERDHVRFLRNAIEAAGGTPVAEPVLDLLYSFDWAANAAGIGNHFDPFANEVNFLIGAFIFEDVGVTAYRGAAPLITDKDYLSAAAGILGTEAYHAAGIRTMLLSKGAAVAAIVQKISDLRDKLDGPGDDDQGIYLNGMVNIVPTNNNGLVYSRTTRQVLDIVYFGGKKKGGFFPEGLNGAIS